ncbi:MAG: hypothetical protein KGJ77_06830 [Acidobacteriota bacterium]|nr:hypothetical protein [Acidobacteriota bacterium]
MSVPPKLALPLVLVTAVLCAGGCGSGPASTGSHDTTTSAGAGPTTAVTSGATTAASRSGSPPTSRPKVELDTLHLLLTTATSAAGTNFEATYKLSSNSTMVTYAQEGSSSSLSTGTATYFASGPSHTVCTVGSPPTCYTGAKPLTGVLAVIIPAQAAAAFRALVANNVPVTLTSETRGGAMSSCIAYEDQGIPVKYCLDSQGYLTFVKVPGGSFVRTSFSTQVTTALSPPAGATYQPAPAGT